MILLNKEPTQKGKNDAHHYNLKKFSTGQELSVGAWRFFHNRIKPLFSDYDR